MKRVTGIGGIFFKSENPPQLYAKYFAASKASFMVNYRVDNLDALLEDLKKSGIEIDPHREDYHYSRFAWITDPDGNRIELWEPPKPKED